MRTRGYFSMPEGAREQASLGNTGLDSRVAYIIWLLQSLFGRFISVITLGVIQGYSKRNEHFEKIITQ